MTSLREIDAHAWEREAHEHYVEPAWVSMRLFDVEEFGAVHDPCCGFGTIVKAAWSHGLNATGADLVDRGFERGRVQNFFDEQHTVDCIVCNPPFDVAPAFAQHALKLAQRKVAMIFPVARLNAAHWIEATPLRRVWLLTPRPSMPPGHVIAAGDKPGGGKTDFVWLVWEIGFTGSSELKWLRRDGRPAREILS